MDQTFLELLRPFLRFAADQRLTYESRLRDLGLDSMQAIELMFAIEDTYAVILPDDKLTDATFETVGSLWAAIGDVQTAGAA
jgi:acyl carrier protein